MSEFNQYGKVVVGELENFWTYFQKTTNKEKLAIVGILAVIVGVSFLVGVIV